MSSSLMTLYSVRIAFLIALLSVRVAPVQAQGIGGFLNKANQKVKQATTTGVGSPAQLPTGGNNGPIPESPSPADLTVDNNIDFAQTVLDNHRPWVLGEHVGADDYYYRYLRDEYKAPLRFTYDRAYVEFITPRQYYLWSVIENISSDIFVFYDPQNPSNRYFRQKMLKIKTIHLTTTNQSATPNHYAGSAGYVMSFDPATGILTAAISVAPGNRGISNINQEDIQAFIQENVK